MSLHWLVLGLSLCRIFTQLKLVETIHAEARPFNEQTTVSAQAFGMLGKYVPSVDVLFHLPV